MAWFPRIRNWGATARERTWAMAGDAFTHQPRFQATLGINIAATPAEIWPWLVQIGYRRGGLYSYDWLDRLFGFLDRPSSERILPEFQDLRVGDEIPLGRGQGFPVRRLDRPRSLVLAGAQDGVEWSWELLLAPETTGHTRLISRTRGSVPPTIGWRFFLLALEPAALLMTRRMLIGVRDRAEAARTGARWAA